MSSGTADKVAGKVKEVAGKVTGDKRLETEGKTDQVKGTVKNATDKVTESVKGAQDSVTTARQSTTDAIADTQSTRRLRESFAASARGLGDKCPRSADLHPSLDARARSRMMRPAGRLAQLAEQLTFNQRVPGSSPGAPTNEFNDLLEVRRA